MPWRFLGSREQSCCRIGTAGAPLSSRKYVPITMPVAFYPVEPCGAGTEPETGRG
jgi:hypothetical protein